MKIPDTNNSIYSANFLEDGDVVDDLLKLKKLGEQRYIFTELNHDDPLWRKFFMFICTHQLDVEPALRYILNDWLDKERRRMLRVCRKRRIVCEKCGCKRWIRRRRVGRGAYNLRCVNCNGIRRVTESQFRNFSDADMGKTFPAENNKPWLKI